MNRSRKILVSAGTLSLLLLTPLYFTHAQSTVFSKDTHGNWEFNSGFQDSRIYFGLITSDGRASFGISPNTVDTSIPGSVNMEVFVADTNGAGFSAPCSSPKYTGNPTVDLACYATAAKNQNFPYGIGQTPKDPTPVVPAPCKCP